MIVITLVAFIAVTSLKENRIMTQTEAVAPVISGPSQADGIARFALRTKYEDLTVERCERLQVSILDAVACAINALGARRSRRAARKLRNSVVPAGVAR